MVNTYPEPSETGSPHPWFEIENSFISLRTIAGVLSATDGVSEVRVRRLFSKWRNIHVWFKYYGEPFIVEEPWGDSSRYLIGPEDRTSTTDTDAVRDSFRNYSPPPFYETLGDILTLRFLRRFFDS